MNGWVIAGAAGLTAFALLAWALCRAAGQADDEAGRPRG